MALAPVLAWTQRAVDPGGGSPYFSAMAKRRIITLPDPILRKVSAPVERIDAEVRKLAEDMLETMYAAPGVGLAAVQVGVPRRLFVLDTAKEKAPPQPLVSDQSGNRRARGGDARARGGCLSIPDERVPIERPSTVTVRFLDREGKTQELAAEGLLATGHPARDRSLNGKLIIDYLSRLKRDMVVRKVPQAGQGDGVARKGSDPSPPGVLGVRPLATTYRIESTTWRRGV
jgi:peptide deformylase